jgi:hypothetical protein
MAGRSGRKKKLGVSPGEQRRALVLVILIGSVPVLGTVAVVVSTSEPDLSDLKPRRQGAANDPVLEWATLRRDHSRAMAADSQAFSGARIRALGYMTDGDRPIATGDRVTDFVLLPDAGNFLHPAHRLGDQMIAVHLRDGDWIPFSPNRLVWVSGTFRVSSGDPGGPKPLYALEQARSQPADKAEIQKYFALQKR